MPRTVTDGRTASQGSRERGVRCCRRCVPTVQTRRRGGPRSHGDPRSDGAP